MKGAGVRCSGLWGRLRGHKWIKVVGGEYVFQSAYCYRCGMPKGGWSS